MSNVFDKSWEPAVPVSVQRGPGDSTRGRGFGHNGQRPREAEAESQGGKYLVFNDIHDPKTE